MHHLQIYPQEMMLGNIMAFAGQNNKVYSLRQKPKTLRLVVKNTSLAKANVMVNTLAIAYFLSKALSEI